MFAFPALASSPGRKFLCNAWADSALNIIADLYPGIFMPNVSSDYRNLEFPEFAQKNLTSQRVTRVNCKQSLQNKRLPLSNRFGASCRRRGASHTPRPRPDRPELSRPGRRVLASYNRFFLNTRRPNNIEMKPIEDADIASNCRALP